MKLSKLYDFVVKEGMAADPRGKEAIAKAFARVGKEYEALKEKDREFFDKEKLTNPYADTRILNGDGAAEIKKALVGVDMEVGEVLLADRMNAKGDKIDLIIAHHPEGKAMANFYEVMNMQPDIWGKFGIPINTAEGLMKDRIKEVERRVLPGNHTRAVDAARLIGIPMMCVHTPADNHVAGYLQELFDSKKPDTLSETVEMLREIPEYKNAAKRNAGPRILFGEPKNRVGKIFVDMTGGTEGPKDIFEKLEAAGVGTIVAMHLGEEHFKNVQKGHINVVIAGHISSDTLGLNLLFDKVAKEDKIEFIGCSGFERISR
ncbi:MAG: NGG1p interacting factor NIF3 [Omnitrophica WOR_2 bacterium RIFCSPLOWO2_12_FULL_51_24]|nr:MAG: NGG1p interacting factor NIF3 [Omnitrophica WOR_2 bacterium RIFCSPLOWO2_12_FULL_51_24]